MQVSELPESSHPRLFRRLGVGYQLVLHRFRDKFAKRDSTFGRNGFGTTKDGIGNFQSGLHEVMLPYLWEMVQSRQLSLTKSPLQLREWKLAAIFRLA
jgi:hypothetical protein